MLGHLLYLSIIKIKFGFRFRDCVCLDGLVYSLYLLPTKMGINNTKYKCNNDRESGAILNQYQKHNLEYVHVTWIFNES